MRLEQIRRLDDCLNSCAETPQGAVAKIDRDKLKPWLEYAESQVWKPKRLRQLIRAARKIAT